METREDELKRYIKETIQVIKEAKESNENCIGYERALRELKQELLEWIK